ncbi:hypothetical protein BASA60_007616 [Batrachochytrium salamandrivorans]|nr:hypothetical protein BASA60_007616 [Batrachochytrium salamandrivorans]
MKRNHLNQYAIDLAHNKDIRSVIEDYSLFSFPPPTGVSHIAKVIRVELVNDKIILHIKSGKYRDFNSIHAVTRTLHDFGLLRNQLLFEHPEMGIPDMRELFSSPTWVMDSVKPGGNNRLLRKIVRRLDRFLDYLLRHGVFSQHELITEFLIVADLEHDMIQARSQSKLAYMYDSVRTAFYPYVENLAENSIKLNEEDSRLLALHGVIRQVGLSVRNVGKARKALGYQIRVLRYNLCWSESSLLNNNLIVSEVLCKSARLMMAHSATEIQDTGDYFLECVYELAGARQGLVFYHQVSEDYVELVKQAASLGTALERLQTQASRSSTEETVRKLSEAYYEHSKMESLVEDKACFLNHITKSLFEDIERFRTYHISMVDQQLEYYVNQQILMEQSLMDSLCDAISCLDAESHV